MTRPPTEQTLTKGRHTAVRGFTLIEVLAALVLLGLILTMLSDGMRLGMRAKRADDQIGTVATELETTSRALRLLFARAEPGEPASPEAVFVGTGHAVSFVTWLPDGRDGPREADVSLAVSAARRLELHWRPHFRRWLVAPPAPGAETLLDGVERLDLAYWPPAGGRWLSQWQGLEPPRLVRLHIVFPTADGRHWPDIIVAPVRQTVQP